MVTDEQWRECPGFADYEVSSEGQVRRVKSKKNKRLFAPLATHIDKRGYHTLNFYMDGRSKTRSIHQLVCEAFHGPRPSPIHHAAHGDGVKTNNDYQNLRWATPLENSADNIRLGRTARGSQLNTPLTEPAVAEIKARLRDGVPSVAISRKFDVSEATISRIKNGLTWRHV